MGSSRSLASYCCIFLLKVAIITTAVVPRCRSTLHVGKATPESIDFKMREPLYEPTPRILSVSGAQGLGIPPPGGRFFFDGGDGCSNSGDLPPSRVPACLRVAAGQRSELDLARDRVVRERQLNRQADRAAWAAEQAGAQQQQQQQQQQRDRNLGREREERRRRRAAAVEAFAAAANVGTVVAASEHHRRY